MQHPSLPVGAFCVRLLLQLTGALSALILCQCATPRFFRNIPAMDSSLTQWTCRDGKQLPFQYWGCGPDKPRAVIICIHGLSGAASDFWPVGESLPSKGYAVYGLQLRGQGNDPDLKRRGDIRSAREWRQDLLDFTALVRHRHPGAPVFWFGESLGALISIDAAASPGGNPPPVAGVILTSPVVALHEHLKLPFCRNLTVRALLRFWPGKRFSLEELGNSEVRVTSGTTHREQMQHTSHYVKDFTVRLFGQIEKMIKHAGNTARRLQLPVLVFYTPNDPLTSKQGVEQFFEKVVSPDKTRIFFPESYHLILHDKDRAAALQRLENWLNERSPKPSPHRESSGK